MSVRQEDVRNEEASLLFKPFALVGLFLCLLASIWFQLYTMIGILAFILVLAGFIFVWNKLAVHHIDLKLELPVSRVFAGDNFRVYTSVKNNKSLPLVWLDVEFNKSQLVSWQDKPFYIVRFMWLLSYQEVDWEVKGRALQRGVYSIGKITMKSGDGFRFMESKKMYDFHKKMYIYPKLVPIRIPPFQPSMQWDVQGKQGGLLEDPLIVSGVRDYEPGDDWKRFNWWASARSGKMQTNVFQPIVAKQLIIVVDVAGFAPTKTFAEEEKQQKYVLEKEKVFESFLSVVASVGVAYHDQGIQIGFATNARNYLNESQEIVQPEKEITSVLDSLA
ncbi:DUF58 domain-containing protein [Pseudogracilibacillus sp. SE30717A]|uniref:DUF58 domain-containing protein n=1 Tax=Pseudogracilibacillus sp. SE30717A TaxID=3098293 RepID=UPI00300DDBD1